MIDETLFFVLGITLTALALIVSFVGLKFEGFPTTKALMGGVVAIFAFFVIGTAVFGWRSAEDEQAHRDAELAEAAEENEATDEGEAQEEIGAEATPAPTATAVADGAAVFQAEGCGSCHTLAAAETSGRIGPDLDGSLPDRDPDYIEESIIDPAARIAKGFAPNVMPTTYGELPPEEIDALVQYLTESTSG